MVQILIHVFACEKPILMRVWCHWTYSGLYQLVLDANIVHVLGPEQKYRTVT